MNHPGSAVDHWFPFSPTAGEMPLIEAAAEEMAAADRHVPNPHVGYALDDGRLVHIPDRALRGAVAVVRAANHAYGAFEVFDTPSRPAVVMVSRGFPSAVLEDGVRFLLPVEPGRRVSCRGVHDYMAMFHMMRAQTAEDRLLIPLNVYGQEIMETGPPLSASERYAAFLLREHHDPRHREPGGRKTSLEIRLTLDGLIEHPGFGTYVEMLAYAQTLNNECPRFRDEGWRVVVASVQRTLTPQAVPVRG